MRFSSGIFTGSRSRVRRWSSTTLSTIPIARRPPGETLGILARIASPVVGPIVDKKVLRTFASASRLTEQAYNDPAALYHTLGANREINTSDLREIRKVLRCCAEDAG